MKYFKTLLTALVMLSPLATEAANYLTVTDTNGSKVSFALTQKPTVSFTASSLRLVAGDQTIDYPLTQYRSFTLTDSNETTGIGTVRTADGTPVFTLGETLQASGLEPNSTVAVYSIGGQVVRQARANASGLVTMPLNGLKGMLVVKAGNKSFKFIRK